MRGRRSTKKKEMNLYCPKCQNLIEKIDEVVAENVILNRMCQRCEKMTNFVVKYKVHEAKEVGKIDKNTKNVYI